ncbi:hypothetical protein VMCG_09972 [Cytospora schulzeri]|uniref:Uncharacterized protein n=1 Tax=Cytospora schulzeri TaxID=448051 RepID=A0A423VIS3_9PEZI|nr:hypothetical protein VMCG_09972 [Valsa malicola]
MEVAGSAVYIASFKQQNIRKAMSSKFRKSQAKDKGKGKDTAPGPSTYKAEPSTSMSKGHSHAAVLSGDSSKAHTHRSVDRGRERTKHGEESPPQIPGQESGSSRAWYTDSASYSPYTGPAEYNVNNRRDKAGERGRKSLRDRRIGDRRARSAEKKRKKGRGSCIIL